MILEVAPLRIRAGQAQAFENSFREAQRIISSMPGYVSHELQRCLERTDEYILLVRWESVDAHETGFRGSPQYQEWKALLHHYYDPFPTVLHFEAVPVFMTSYLLPSIKDSQIRGESETGMPAGKACNPHGFRRGDNARMRGS